MACRGRSVHEQHALLEVLGQSNHFLLLVQGLAIVDHIDVAADVAQVPLSIQVQIRAGGQPEMPPAPPCLVVQHDACNLPALAHPCSIPNEEASTCKRPATSVHCMVSLGEASASANAKPMPVEILQDHDVSCFTISCSTQEQNNESIQIHCKGAMF